MDTVEDIAQGLNDLLAVVRQWCFPFVVPGGTAAGSKFVSNPTENIFCMLSWPYP